MKRIPILCLLAFFVTTTALAQNSATEHAFMLYFDSPSCAESSAKYLQDQEITNNLHSPFNAVSILVASENEINEVLASMPQGCIPESLPALRFDDGFAYYSGNILVSVQKDIAPRVTQELIKTFPLELVDEYQFADETILSLRPNHVRDLLAIERSIESLEAVGSVNPDIIGTGRSEYLPNDPSLGLQWFISQGSDADIDAPEAWDITTGSANIVISVIDGDGYDLDHPDLAANIFNPFDAVNSDNDPSIESINEKHGTPCAGLAGAVGDNNTGVAGVAYDCKVMPIRMAYDHSANGSWFTSSSIILNAADHTVATAGVAVVSCSWFLGSWADANTTVITAFSNMKNLSRNGEGAVVCVATGNDNSSAIPAPANYSSTLGVGASSSNDTRASFSNYGDFVDFVAPGVSCYTTDMADGEGYNGQDYTYFSGTSAACPVAAGAIGLIASAYPSLTGDELTELVLTTCEKVGGYGYSPTPGYDFSTWNNEMGYGRINPYLALLEAESLVGCTGDYDGNETIDTADLLTLLGGFGCQSNCFQDLTGDDIVNSNDLLLFLAVLGTDC